MVEKYFNVEREKASAWLFVAERRIIGAFVAADYEKVINLKTFQSQTEYKSHENLLQSRKKMCKPVNRKRKVENVL